MGYSIESIATDIQAECDRQEELKRKGKFLWTCADIHPILDKKLSVLSEEFGEVSKEVVDYGITSDKYIADKLQFPPHRKLYFLKRIREELIQVAAVCVAWCEAIDKEISESLDSHAD
jgi:hypothetical protein